LPSFLSDWQALPQAERAFVKRWLTKDFLPAVAAYETDPTAFVWPRGLRFERLQATADICAVTWSFAGPDGRATFQFTTVDGEPCLIWRRIGRHDVYRRP
jgi:hypothetical protein